MLERLLEALRAEGTQTVAGLARELDVSPSLVEMMIEDLTRMGYLSSVSATCPAHCTACSVEGCGIAGESGRVWTLTQKGLE